MDIKLMSCFEECKMGTIMDIITPLINQYVPKQITNFHEQNEYMREHFVAVFMKVYRFIPNFKVNEEKSEISIKIKDALYFDELDELIQNVKKIKELLTGFSVNIEMNIHLFSESKK
jgi:hypothetical protein